MEDTTRTNHASDASRLRSSLTSFVVGSMLLAASAVGCADSMDDTQVGDSTEEAERGTGGAKADNGGTDVSLEDVQDKYDRQLREKMLHILNNASRPDLVELFEPVGNNIDYPGEDADRIIAARSDEPLESLELFFDNVALQFQAEARIASLAEEAKQIESTESPYELPSAGSLVDVAVERDGTNYTIKVTNTSDQTDLTTPLSPIVYLSASGRPDSVTDRDPYGSLYRVFTPGEPASEALESLAEDGSPQPLADELDEALKLEPEDTEDPGSPEGTVFEAGVASSQGGSDGDVGPVKPGETYSFTLDIKDDFRAHFNIVSMVVESNDAFVSFRHPVELGSNCNPSEDSSEDSHGRETLPNTCRETENIEEGVRKQLTVFDAGTEVDQVPGEGSDQPARQSGPDTGADDPEDYVNEYWEPRRDHPSR